MRGITDPGPSGLIYVFEDLTFEAEFSEPREAPRAPSNAHLRALDLYEDERPEAPDVMTGNDAFRIIEIIKEREALRARLAS